MRPAEALRVDGGDDFATAAGPAEGSGNEGALDDFLRGGKRLV
jgi:hypothetical protein